MKQRSTVALLVRVDPEVVQQLRQRAIEERRTMSNVTAFAIRQYILRAKARSSEENEDHADREHV